MNRFMAIWFGYVLNAITKIFGEFGSDILNAAFSLIGGFFGLIFIPSINNIYLENTTIIWKKKKKKKKKTFLTCNSDFICN